MECTFDSSRLRDFVRALRCLSSFGDELSIVATPHDLRLSAVSASRSAFALISLERDFFTHYRIKTDPSSTPQASTSTRSSADTQNLQISVTARALLNAVGKRSTMTSVEDVSISILFDEPPAQGSEDGVTTECRLVIKLYCRHGVVKTHRLTFASEMALTPLFDRSACTSHWTTSSSTLDEWVTHFSTSKRTGTEEISLMCGPDVCKLKSYEPNIDSLADPREREDLSTKAISTAINVDVQEFDEYFVEGEEVLTFGLKEFKAIIAFGKEAGSALDADYLSGGQPLMITIRGDGYCADFVLATTADDPAEIKSEPPPDRPRARSSSKHQAQQGTQRRASAQPVPRQASIVPDPEPEPSASKGGPALKPRYHDERMEAQMYPQHPSAEPGAGVESQPPTSDRGVRAGQPLFRPSMSPTPSPAFRDQPQDDGLVDPRPVSGLELEDLDEDQKPTIPDSQMHESFEPWPQRVAQRGEPQHTTLAKDDVADVTLSQDSGGEDEDATLDSAPPAKKPKGQIFD